MCDTNKSFDILIMYFFQLFWTKSSKILLINFRNGLEIFTICFMIYSLYVMILESMSLFYYIF